MIETVITKRARDLGGFTVGRVLPFAGGRMVGPFIFFDHLGPVDFKAGLPRTVDVRPHPHIGLSTVTYLFDGEIMHRDSVGSAQPIRAEEVNWMIAGRGITHSERFEKARREGDRLHGVQAWVALPDTHEETDPAFFHHGRADLPVIEDDAGTLRVIAGEAFGARSAVRVHSPLFYVHARLRAGGRLAMPTGYAERGAYVATGSIEADHRALEAGSLALFTRGAGALITAREDSIVMLLGGEPVGQRFIEWNFVSSSKARIDAAKADWRAGRLKLPDLDAEDFIPLPDESGRPNS